MTLVCVPWRVYWLVLVMSNARRSRESRRVSLRRRRRLMRQPSLRALMNKRFGHYWSLLLCVLMDSLCIRRCWRKRRRERSKKGGEGGEIRVILSLFSPPLKSPLLNSKPDIEAIKSGGMWQFWIIWSPAWHSTSRCVQYSYGYRISNGNNLWSFVAVSLVMFLLPH